MKESIIKGVIGLTLTYLTSAQTLDETQIGDYVLKGPFPTEECRRCQDHFNNSYYCLNTFVPEGGTCCPFPIVDPNDPVPVPDLIAQIDTKCVETIQLNQRCSHDLHATAVGTPEALAQRAYGLQGYYVCYNEEPQCGGTSVLEIAVPNTEEVSDDGWREEIFKWSFQELKPDFRFCNWQIKVKNYNANSLANDEKFAGYTAKVNITTNSQAQAELVATTNKQFDMGFDGT